MSKLELNEQVVPFKEFYGRNNEQMAELVADERVPLSVAGLMRQRLAVSDSSSQKVQSAWWNNYFDTGDGFFYHPDGNVKIVRNANPIREMNGSSSLSSGALVLHEDRGASIEVYNGLDGAEFTRNELNGLVGRTLSLDDVKSHPVWNALVGDESLLVEYAQTTFSKGKEQFGYDNMMGVWLGSSQDVAVGRLCYVDDLNNYSNALGINNILGSNGRLVGVAPEVLGTQTGKYEK